MHWDEVDERMILGHELAEPTVGVIETIREKMKIAQDRQKSYANKRRKDLHFEIGDKVLLKISPMKGAVHFRKRKVETLFYWTV